MAERSIPFEEAANVTGLNSHAYRAYVHPDYSLGPRAHGGNLFAVIFKAISIHFDTTLAASKQNQPLSLHIEFLRLGKIGDVQIDINDVRTGRNSSTVLATCTQDGKQIAAVFATYVISAFDGLTIALGTKPDSSVPPIDFAAVRENKDPNWLVFRWKFNPNSPMNALSHYLYIVEKPQRSDLRVCRQWWTSVDATYRFRNENLAILIDHFVMPLENFVPDSNYTLVKALDKAERWSARGMSAKDTVAPYRTYTTLSFSLQIKRPLPTEGVQWLFTEVSIMDVVNGKCDVEARVWDVEGRLVALATSQWHAFPTGQGKPQGGTEKEKAGESRL